MPPIAANGSGSGQIKQQLDALGVAQVIVVMKQPSALAGAASGLGAGAPARLRKYFVSSELSAESAIRYALRSGVAAGLAATASTRRRAMQPARPVRVYPNLGVMLGTVTPASLSALRSDSDVAAVLGAPPLSLIKPQKSVEATIRQKIGWGIDALGVPDLWKQGLSGKGVVVAHLDTGADGRHPMLKSAFAAFTEFDLAGDELVPAPSPHDSGEHGTHTAITIAGRASGGNSLGVAPGAKLASAIVIEGGSVVARVLGGLDWALGKEAKVLSMSLGLRGWWEDFVQIVRILRTRGILPVIASGNEGPGTSRSPGNYSDALSVGAMDKGVRVADFSSSQRFARTRDPIVPDLVGPGVDIVSGVPNGGYKMMSGTSMATPHLAGLAALLFEAKPRATVDDVERAIFRSCKLSGMLAERAGQGHPDASDALSWLTGQTPTKARTAVRPAARRLGRRAPVKTSARRTPSRKAKVKGSRRRSGA